MTNNHTFVIPTLNRPALLKRLVQYYHRHVSHVNLLVLDSSDVEIAKENAETLSQFTPSLRHIIFEPTVSLSSKLSRGFDLVQTPYVSLCADDDFVFPDGLHEALEHLDHHPDYVCAHGIYINFRQAGRDVHLRNEYSGPSNEAVHAGARIFRLCQKYESLYYAVFRTQDLRDIFVLLPKLDTLLFQELFQSVAAVIKGKVKRFRSLYAARQYGPPAEPQRANWNTFQWFAENPGEVLERYRAYRETICTFYEMSAPEPRLDKGALSRTLDLAHAVYFSSGSHPRNFYSALQKYWPGDPYRMIGPLDLLRLADKQMAFMRAVHPDGDPGADMIEQLQTAAGISRWVGAGILAALRYTWLATWWVAKAARLDFEIRRDCRTPWRCRLPFTARWLAAAPKFRSSYLELCRYLDQS